MLPPKDDVRLSRFAMQSTCAVAVVMAIAGWLVLTNPGDRTDRLVADVSYTVAPLAAFLAAGWRARRDRSRGWALLAVAFLMWTSGSAVWLVTELTTASPLTFPSIAEVGYLGYAVPAAAGLLSFPLLSLRETTRWWGALDAAVIASSLLFISWATVMGPAITANTGDVLTRVSAAAYPVVDVALASLVLALGTRAPARAHRQWLLLGTGITTLVLTNHVYAIQAQNYVQGTVLDIGWVIAFACCTLAALAPTSDVTVNLRRPHGARFVRQALPYLPLMAALIIAIEDMIRTNDLVLHLLGLAMLLCFVGRQATLLVDNARLTGDLTSLVHSRTAELELLRTVATTSNEAESIQLAMQRVLRAVCDYSGWQVGHAFLLSEGPIAELRDTHVWYADHPRRYEALMDATMHIRFTEGVGLPGSVLASGEVVWHSDISKATGMVRSRWMQECGVAAAFALPVMVDRSVVAVVEFFSTRPAERDERLLDAMRDVVNQLGRVVERDRAEVQLRHQATHDPLTDLPNRVLFEERVEHALTHLNRRQGKVGVLLVDLDGFKDINDSLGHAVGDDLLIEIARRLRGGVRPTDTVARLGGDEFAIVLEDEGEGGAAERVAAAVLEAVATPMTIARRSFTVTASIGVALVSQGMLDGVGEMLRNADLAMYRAKKAGKGRAVVFEHDWHAESVARLELETDLRRAVEHGEFSIHYQPVAELATGRVVGTEALLRWFHPQRGPVSPAEFIPVAEETRLILAMGEWVLDEAVRQTRMWQRKAAAHSGLAVAVNVSVEQLRPEFSCLVAAVLDRHAFEPSLLTIEVTESMLVHEETAVTQVLHEISDLGVKVAVDDFGTGYSALQRMRQFPVDVLKIDRSFVSQLGEGAGDPLITAMIALGHGMGLHVVAEGIESPHQLHFLAEHQCDLGQGYLLSAPLPADEVEAMLAVPLPAVAALRTLDEDRLIDRLDAELLPLIATAMNSDVELESLVRPMLTKLAGITGFESTYITQIHWDAGTQSVEISRNAGALDLPEGAVVPWRETLCQHAMPAGLTTADVTTRFPDSTAAIGLGIRSYSGVPICKDDGSVYGTLCGASTARVPQPPENIELMNLFARVIGHLISSPPVSEAGARHPSATVSRTRGVVATKDDLIEGL